MRILLISLVTALALVILPAAHALTPPPPVSYAGKTVLVTGSTDGLGRELALALAADGAHVIVHGRNTERGQAVVERIRKSGKGRATFYPADFASLESVRAFAALVARNHPRLHLLVNNAGVALGGSQPRRTSADGHELQFAVNYLAGWVLVNQLRPNLAAAAPSRIVNVASLSGSAMDFDDVMLEKPGAHARGYGHSKLAQVTMTVALAPAFQKQGITMISLHPASMMDTTMVRGLGVAPRTSVDEGRDHVMGLVTAPGLQPGAFYLQGVPGDTRDPQPQDAQARAKLVALSEKLTGVAFSPR